MLVAHMEEYIPALELIVVEMGRLLNVRVVPMVISERKQRGDLSIDLSEIAPAYFMYIQSNESNMTEPVTYAINPTIKVFRRKEELRRGGENLSPNQLMQDIRGLTA